MKGSPRMWNYFSAAGVAVVCLLLVGTALAQVSTQTTTQTGQATEQSQVRKGEVVYVSGNDLVVKLEDGQVKHFTVPPDAKFDVDGKELTVDQLTPGTKLTQTITTTTTPKTVTTVHTITGKVWYVAPPKVVILAFPDGTHHKYNVPEGTKFDVNGKQTDVFALKKGMDVSATVVSETAAQHVNVARNVTGEAPPPAAPETPPMVGVLLVEVPAPAPAEQPQQTASAKLPQTASTLPLIGLLGLLAIAASFGVRRFCR